MYQRGNLQSRERFFVCKVVKKKVVIITWCRTFEFVQDVCLRELAGRTTRTQAGSLTWNVAGRESRDVCPHANAAQLFFILGIDRAGEELCAPTKLPET